MATEKPFEKQEELDRSIDLGLDQFGRFVRHNWFWLLLGGFVLWYFFSNIFPQLSAPSPEAIFAYLFEVAFAIFYILIQFIALFWFLGRPRLYWLMPGETGVSFKDYKGNPEVLEQARRIVTILQGIKEFRDMGGQPIRGLLLSGPPGTGKSYLAQCISSEAQVPFGYASAASFRNMFWGIDVLIIMRLYRRARKLAREYGACILFLDEIDALGASRTSPGRMPVPAMGGGLFGFMGTGGALNQLLMEMDPPPVETGWFKKILRVLGLYHGRVQREPVLTIGATNLPEALDPALLRPGRFDRRINVAPPTDKYRGEVIQYYLDKVKHDPNIPINTLVYRMAGYTPVEIKHVINEAVIIAYFSGRDEVIYQDIIEAQDIHELGYRRESNLSLLERRRIAYHEAGHAVASYYLRDRYLPPFVTIHQRSDLKTAAAFALPRPKETIVTTSKEELLAHIQVSLASRAAEELFLNTQLDGVFGDLRHATELAASYIGLYGMDGTLVSYGAFVPEDSDIGSILSSFPMDQLRERIEAVLQSQFKAVKRLLQEHREAVIAVAESLIERDELSPEEVEELINQADTHRVTVELLPELAPVLGLSQDEADGDSHLALLPASNGHAAGESTPSESAPHQGG
ncbi:AAA family ATPase [Thermogemmatispora sp.]|uniref:AAA family ATPase n=1 Tax=Thermogemmatispora sp. TaxID=1968838 RepID=UPI001D61F45D|nr:AAA family ATPase [Thermogemmatispora sp.]MBX5448584.1 AAA family ATPase [Thermogemmatispora sp.]